MSKASPTWTNTDVNEYMQEFIVRVQKNGYITTLDNALKDVTVFKRVGKQSLLFSSLSAVAQADGTFSDKEMRLCQRVKALAE